MCIFRNVLKASDDYKVSEDECFVIHQMHSPEFSGLEDDDLDLTDNPEEDRDVPYETSNVDNGDNILEDWGDDVDSDTADKPWNDPANWNLSIEVTNPELIDNLRKKGGDYMQGFHQGLLHSSNAKKFQRWTYYLEPGQTDDAESEVSEGQDSQKIVEILSEINLAELRDTTKDSQVNCDGKELSCDIAKDAAEDTKVDSNNTAASCDNLSQDFGFTPLTQVKHHVYTKAWFKPYCDTEEGQFDSE